MQRLPTWFMDSALWRTASFTRTAHAPLAALARAAAAPVNPVACQTNAWRLQAGDFPELLKRLAVLERLGYAGFECNVRFVQGQFANAREARARIQDTGVRFYGTHTGLRFGMDELQRSIDGAASLGAERFALSGAGAVLVKEAVRHKAESINQVGKRCKQAGLRLVYHNHESEFAAGGAEIEEIVRLTDPELVWLLFDVGHAGLVGADVPAFLTRRQRRIDALHVRDFRAGQQVPLGQGEFDFGALAAAIRKTGWSGWLTLEEESLKSDDNAYVESVLSSGRELIRKTLGA